MTTLHLGDCSTDCAQCVANCSCEKCSSMKKDAKAKREWESNQCEGCFSPLRDCVCELCEVCDALVTQCDCNRCEDCGTIYAAEDVAENLNENNNCANCANEIGE